MNHPKIEGKTAAIVSYFWLFGVIIAFYMNSDKKHSFAYFHIRQSLGLWLTYMIFAYITGYFDSWNVSLPFFIFFAVLFFYGFFTAATGNTRPIPILGALYQRIFSKLGS
jgi:uncharacterized membrane protein